MIYQIKNTVDVDLGDVKLHHQTGFTAYNVPGIGTYDVSVSQAVTAVEINSQSVDVGMTEDVTLDPNIVVVRVSPQSNWVDILDTED